MALTVRYLMLPIQAKHFLKMGRVWGGQVSESNLIKVFQGGCDDSADKDTCYASLFLEFSPQNLEWKERTSPFKLSSNF